jgi:glycosyltransferase involved in cell wall biosynthesis
MTPVDPRPTIAFLAPSLEVGGAERQLLALAAGLDPQRWNVRVIAGAGTTGQPEWTVPDGMELPVIDTGRLGFRRALRQSLERHGVDVLHAYLLSAQAKAWVVRATGWRGRLIVGVRDSIPVWDTSSAFSIVANWAVFGGSWFVDQYVFNSHSGARAKAPLVPAAKQTVIPNGIDIVRFRPDSDAGARLRQLADIPARSPVIGTVANVARYKDYPTLIEAVRLVLEQRPDVYVVAIGDHQTPLFDEVREQVSRAGVADRMRFLGARVDVEQLVPGFDVACSSSQAHEGFSNAVAEAMACGVVPIVTDVGDAARIVADAGLSVPPRDPVRLAQALLRALAWTTEERRARGADARRRIVDSFSIERMVAAHEALYARILPLPRPQPHTAALAR